MPVARCQSLSNADSTSLERRVFGSKPVHLTQDDLEGAENAVTVEYDGDTCFFNLKIYSPGFQSGVELLVNRTTGQVIVYPPGSKNPLVDIARGLYSEIQHKLGKKYFGRWSADSTVLGSAGPSE
jgi:hypothetical protein